MLVYVVDGNKPLKGKSSEIIIFSGLGDKHLEGSLKYENEWFVEKNN